MGVTADFKAAQGAITRALGTVRSFQSDSNPALLKQALTEAVSTLGSAQAAMEFPGTSDRASKKITALFPGTAGFSFVEGAQPLTDEMIAALEEAVSAYTGTVAPGSVIALAYTPSGWVWFINTESETDRSQIDALVNSDIYNLPDPAGRVNIGVLGTLLLGDNDQPVTVYTTKPGIQISIDDVSVVTSVTASTGDFHADGLVDVTSLPADLQTAVGTAVAAAVVDAPSSPYPDSIGIFVANITSADDGTPLGWNLVASTNSTDSPSDIDPMTYAVDLSTWAGAYSSSGSFVGTVVVTNPDQTTTNVYVWATDPGIGISIQAVDVTTQPADVQVAIDAAVVSVVDPSAPYPDSIGIVVDVSASGSTGEAPLDWSLSASTNSIDSPGYTSPALYSDNLSTWAPTANPVSYVGEVPVVNGDGSITTVYVWTTYIDLGGTGTPTDFTRLVPVNVIYTWVAGGGDWPTLSTTTGTPWPPSNYVLPAPPDERGYMDGIYYTFDEPVGQILIPSSLWYTIYMLLHNDGVIPDQSAVNAIAIPYLTEDALDFGEETYNADNANLTDAWVSDLAWLVYHGFTFTSGNGADLDPQVCAADMGLDMDVWCYLGTTKFPNGGVVLIFTTLPGFWGSYDGSQITVDDEGADSNVYNTGLWPFVTLAQWGHYNWLDTQPDNFVPASGEAIIYDSSLLDNWAANGTDFKEGDGYTFEFDDVDKNGSDVSSFQFNGASLETWHASGPSETQFCNTVQLKVSDQNGNWGLFDIYTFYPHSNYSIPEPGWWVATSWNSNSAVLPDFTDGIFIQLLPVEA